MTEAKEEIEALLLKAGGEALKEFIPPFAIKKSATAVALLKNEIDQLALAEASGSDRFSELVTSATTALKDTKSIVASLDNYIEEAEAHLASLGGA